MAAIEEAVSWNSKPPLHNDCAEAVSFLPLKKMQMFAEECIVEWHSALQGKKNEAVPPQHYLSPNQIKPNYSFVKLLSADKGNMLCVNPTTRRQIFFEKIFI